jgi:hypothetical protein
LRTLLVNVNPFLAAFFEEDWLLPVCEEKEVAAQFLTISEGYLPLTVISE